MAKKKTKKKAKKKTGKRSPVRKATSRKATTRKRAKKAPARKKARRTTHRSGAGKKLYAVRTAEGRFKDIQQYSRAHAQDIKRRAADEG